MSKHYDDDYEGENFEKFTHRKNKGHKKGHQSRAKKSEKYAWGDIVEKTYDPEATVPQPSETEQNPTHQFGEHTHEIKGVKIDFDGVADIQKVDNEKDGTMTYGIKFLFKGKKGLFRIIWFNTNLRARDATYNTEYAFWLSIKGK